MKLIEALKEIPAQVRKADDLRALIANNCALMDYEKPSYGTADEQKKKVSEWIQSHSDILKRIEFLKTSIALTNVQTNVPIKFSIDLTVTKPITGWIARRQQLVELEEKAWRALTDRNLKEEKTTQTDKQTVVKSIVRFFDPAERDNRVALYRMEPMLIDSALEIINATTDLIEAK